MSRIGRLPIQIPQGVTVTVNGDEVLVKGSKGELSYVKNPDIKVVVEESTVLVSRNSENPDTASLYGLSRTLIDNMVIGVSEGFKKQLEINGIGYRAAINGNKLTLNLGYSHQIDYVAPTGITITVEKNLVTVAGIDKQAVGQVAAEIRAFRKPEPYKGKGVKYVDEVIRRKAGKTGGK